MSFMGNILWLIFGGFITGMGYIIGGLAMCLTIVGIPFGLQSIRLGVATFTPFGKEVVENERSSEGLAVVFDLLWLIFFGWEIAVAHLIVALLTGITIIGIPFATQHLKLIPVALFPFSRELR
jgi:uncharacterized membrane protein YccF (DUF307 family)